MSRARCGCDFSHSRETEAADPSSLFYRRPQISRLSHASSFCATLIQVTANSHRPTIGVFDSGFGGLTVLRAIARLVPNADYLFFGDTARLPYGTKSQEFVARYSSAAARFLASRGIDLLVIGCNTASALALYDIKSAVSLPVIGVIEPGADAAAAISKSREALVFATEATCSSHAYQRALARRGFATHEKACPLLVSLVEEGWVESPVTEQVARIYTIEALRTASTNVDVLVLGCTHFPLLRPLLRRVVPQRIQIVDSAEATASALLLQLNGHDLQAGKPAFQFFVTDSVEKFRKQAPLFLGFEVEDVERADLDAGH
jgi:glutamate racemase